VHDATCTYMDPLVFSNSGSLNVLQWLSVNERSREAKLKETVNKRSNNLDLYGRRLAKFSNCLHVILW